jgi:hypothetical protein
MSGRGCRVMKAMTRTQPEGTKTAMRKAAGGWRWMVLVTAGSFLFGGCSYLHKPESTAFDPSADGFKFRAIADAAYPEETANGEAWRMKWLEQRLAETGTCPHGYTITARETKRLSTGALGSIYDVNYEGRCNDAAQRQDIGAP